MSSQTIVYKGMLRSCDLPKFYKDLTDSRYKTNFAVYHRRFSTNTVPKWFLAQVSEAARHTSTFDEI
jgi:glutamate synthase (ferredoxin)